MVKAALHVHSTYSDGEFTLAELREKFLVAGCSVIGMADHADAFDDAKVAAYVAECERLSDARLRFMAGLEFGCVDRMHIVGYGVTALIDSDDPKTVITHIRANGGIAVIAHPPARHFELIASLDELPDGIEGWNSKYDGRYAPRPATFELIDRVQRRRPDLKAFYGQDLHWRQQYAELFNEIDTSSGARGDVLAALRAGGFTGVKDTLRLPSNGRIPAEQMHELARISARSQRFRSAVQSIRKLLGSAVKRMPAPIKARLRRIF